MNEPMAGSGPTDLAPHKFRGVPTGRFRSMARLLTSEDFAQVLLQPEMSQADMRALKRERRAVLLAYLRDLRVDSIVASRLTGRAAGQSVWSLSGMRGRCCVEFALLRIAAI